MRLHIFCVLIATLISTSIAIDKNQNRAGDLLAKKIMDIVKAGGGYGYVFDDHSYKLIYGGKKKRVAPDRKVLRDRRRGPRRTPRRRISSPLKDNTSIASDQIL